MPNFCAAYGCSNSSQKENCVEENISFHRFPIKNAELLMKWVNKLSRKDFMPTEHSRLCSKHFASECFYYQKSKRMLKPDAVPSLFSHVAEKKQRQRTSYEFGLTSDDAIAHMPPPSSVEVSTETDDDIISVLLQRNTDLESEIKCLTYKFEKSSFNVESVTQSPLCKSVTGFTGETFNVIYDFLNLEKEVELKSPKVSNKQQFFLFLAKMKSGVSDEFLSVATNMPLTSLSRYLRKMTAIIYAKIKSINIWQEKEQIMEYMPEKFKNNFPEVVIIIDSTEFKIQRPSSPTIQQLTFSSYKNCNTLKGLIGIAPSGAITYISDLWCGSISDKELFMKSGIIEKLQPGDSVMADKGFTIRKELEDKKCKLLQPIFMSDKIQFAIEEKAQSSKVSRLRVHVERAISRIKNFKYFQSLTNHSLQNVNENFYIICFLTMFNNSLISF